MSKVICVGSGDGGVQYINDHDTSDCIIVGVNNVWKGTDKWDHIIYPTDYDYISDIKPNSHQQVHSRKLNNCIREPYHHYSGAKEWNKAMKYCGRTMYFTCMYWALYYMKPTIIGCLGFDMDYTPKKDGSTAFYGVGTDIKRRGIPDPFKAFQEVHKDLKDPMKTLCDRVQKAADEQNCKIVNLSDKQNTRLPWVQVSWEKFNE